MLFLGTSVQRYQYLSLLHFIDKATWPERCTTAHLPESNTPLEFGMPGPYTVNRSTYDRDLLEKHGLRPSVVKEREWARQDENHWAIFFNATRGLFGDRERCDCGALGGDDSHRDMTPTGKPVAELGRHWCSRRLERRFYSNAKLGVNVTFLTSDCGGKCADWVRKCSACWHQAGVARGSQQWLLLAQGLQSGWFHPGDCYKKLADGASVHLRDGGQGFWLTTNWPDRAFLFGRAGGYAVRGRQENSVAVRNVTLEATTHPCYTTSATCPHMSGSSAGGGSIQPWQAFDLAELDQRLRKLEARLNTVSPLRWDPFHYEPAVYEILNTLLLGKMCPRTLRWACEGDVEADVGP